MNQDEQLRIENLRAEYLEVCQSHHAISEFRAKLLALLPLASGAGVSLLLRKKGDTLDLNDLGAIAVFGFFITLGLFFHELRGIQRCNDLSRRAKILELKLDLGGGQFTETRDAHLGKLVGATGAAWIIYLATLGAWIYVAGVGFCWW